MTLGTKTQISLVGCGLVGIGACAARVYALFNRESVSAGVVAFIALSAVFISQILVASFFARWLERAYGNLAVIGFDAHYSPSMAVLVFIVPFVNLYGPQRVMNDLLHGSSPAVLSAATRRTVAGDRTRSHAWYYLFLTACVLSDVLYAVTNQRSELRLPIAIIMVVSQQCATAAAFLAMSFVEKISDLQERCAAVLRLNGRTSDADFVERGPVRIWKSGSVASALLWGMGLVAAVELYSFVRSLKTDEISSSRELLVIATVAAVLTGILFLWWIHRVASNLARMRFSPEVDADLAVLGLLAPLFNVFYLNYLLQRFWRASLRRGGDRLSSPDASGDDAQATRLFSADVSMWMGAVAVLSECIAIWWIVATGDVHSGVYKRSLAAFAAGELGSLVALTVAVYRLQRVQNRREKWFVPPDYSGSSMTTSSQSAPKASWKDVLLPIAASVDDGLGDGERDTVKLDLASRLNAPGPPATPVLRFARVLTSLLRVVLWFTWGIETVFLLTLPRTTVFFTAGRQFVYWAAWMYAIATPSILLFVIWIWASYRNVDGLTGGQTRHQKVVRFLYLAGGGSVVKDMTTALSQFKISETRAPRSEWTLLLRLFQVSPFFAFVLQRDPTKTLYVVFLVSAALAGWVLKAAINLRSLNLEIEDCWVVVLAKERAERDRRERLARMETHSAASVGAGDLLA